ncbi:hypothetical protein G9A89_002000 [Geosiphon pyriformis]|nr:hypothetical protein G9A89_002000 [Geosiphon pyriformis]
MPNHFNERTELRRDQKPPVTFSALSQKQHSKNNFKVATTPDTTTLKYYQSIYTYCKQRFNISDGIEVVKKSVYQYIENCINSYLFGNYNISEVRSNLYNNLVHYSQLRTKDLNSETLATYFQELNFNIIKYCEETYLVQSQYFIDFESETETSNKDKQKLKQYSKTTPNTPILPKTTAKHLQTPEQGTSSKLLLTITSFPASLAQAQTPNSPLNRFARLEDFTLPRSPTRQQESLQTSSNFLDFLAENQSEHSETAANKENDSEISKEESINSENEENKMTPYITKIPEFNEKDIETSSQEYLDQVTKAGNANGWNAARMLRTILYFLKETAGKWFKNLTTPFNDWTAFKTAFLEQFTDNNTSITLQNCFHNIKQEPSKSVITYIGKFNKLFKQICQLETNDYYSDAQILDQFITGLKDKLIKKVCPHAPEDLNSAIQHAKRYEMAIEEANCTKLMNLAIGETSSAAEEKIDQLTKKVKNYFTNQQQQQPQRYQPPQRRNQNNFTSSSNNQPQNCHYCGISGHWKRDCKKLQRDQQNRSNQHYSLPQQFYYQPPLLPAYYPPRPQYQTDYYQPAPQPIQHYQVPARRLVQQNQFASQNQFATNNNRINPNNQLPRPTHYHTQPSYLTIPEEQDFHHTALSEGRAAAQQQNPSYIPTTISPARIAENANLSDIFSFEFKANESPFLLSNAATNEQKAITAMYTKVEVEGKTIHLILDSGSAESIITYQLIQQLKKNTPVEEIDNFPFTLNGITISVKVLVMNAPQLENPRITNLLLRTICPTPAFEFKPEEEKPIIKTFMALESTSNWAEETEQEHFIPYSEPETPGWNIPYSKPEPRKQCPYIPLKYKDCHKKLSSMGACILPKKEYENGTPCFTCEKQLPNECNWIDVAFRGGVCDQTCQYALSIAEKVKRGTPFNVTYNSTLSKLYHYPHNAEMIYKLVMVLINRGTKKDVLQMKEAEYIEYTLELAGFDYEDEQMNIKLCEECIMPCDEQWCPECYTLSIPLLSKSNKYEIEFRESETTEEIETTPIYLIKNQSALQLKYFNNNGQGIKLEKAHEIDAGYDLRYPEKDTLVFQPNSLTKINFKVALKIPPRAMVQITS